MTCKSMLYAVNQTDTLLASGSVIPLGSVRRKTGKCCDLYGDSVILKGAGYYDIRALVSFNPTATTGDTYTIQMYKNGVAVPGAVSSVYAVNSETLPVMAIVRTQCCAEAEISFEITAGTATNTVTVTNVAVEAEKL